MDMTLRKTWSLLNKFAIYVLGTSLEIAGSITDEIKLNIERYYFGEEILIDIAETEGSIFIEVTDKKITWRF